MIKAISSYLEKLNPGEAQSYENMVVFPLFTSINHSPEYLTLKEALDKGLLTVTEVSHGGSVPELKATKRQARESL